MGLQMGWEEVLLMTSVTELLAWQVDSAHESVSRACDLML